MTIATGIAEVQSGLLSGLAAQRVRLHCPHGQSTFFLLPARNREANEAALDFVWVRHMIRHGCECERKRANERGGRSN